jgi:hypothetical protein
MERGKRKKIDAVDLFVGGVMREVWLLAELRRNISQSLSGLRGWGR